jgi:hypothetical protein
MQAASTASRLSSHPRHDSCGAAKSSARSDAADYQSPDHHRINQPVEFCFTYIFFLCFLELEFGKLFTWRLVPGQTAPINFVPDISSHESHSRVTAQNPIVQARRPGKEHRYLSRGLVCTIFNYPITMHF